SAALPLRRRNSPAPWRRPRQARWWTRRPAPAREKPWKQTVTRRIDPWQQARAGLTAPAIDQDQETAPDSRHFRLRRLLVRLIKQHAGRGVDPSQIVVDRLHSRDVFCGDNEGLALAFIGNAPPELHHADLDDDIHE